MKYKKEYIKLRHLEHLDKEHVDYAYLMKDVLGYTNTWLEKKLLFKSRFKKIYDLIKQFGQIDISQLSAEESVKKMIPENVDLLTYQARIEIDQIRRSQLPIGQVMGKIIALTSFNHIHKVKFNSDSQLFKKWEKHILNQPLLEMAGLYNDIIEQLDKSNDLWNKLFFQVHVTDKDYDQAGGQTYLGRFDLLNVIKRVMNDFNVSYEEAFLMEFRLIQTNGLEAASRGFIGEQMRTIKEQKFKAQRK